MKKERRQSEEAGQACFLSREEEVVSSISVSSVSSALGSLSERKREFSLKKLANGLVTLRDESIGETFHPVIGAREEARRLYVDQTGLAAQWRDPKTQVKRVWDVGLGAAANAVAVVESWLEGEYGDLCLESFDQDAEALCFALQQMAGEPESFAHLQGWDWDKLLGEGKLVLSKGKRKLVWNYHQGDFRCCYPSVVERPDLVMYDLYSALKCPELYTLKLWESLGDYQQGYPCLIVLHTRSTAVRVTLLLAGWYVGVGTGLGEKEETTLVSNDLAQLTKPLDCAWRQKVLRSTSAFPLLENRVEKRPITQEWIECLNQHPQWLGKEKRDSL
jgi:hypothetical protein